MDRKTDPVKLGRCIGVLYESTKLGEGLQKYYHIFRKDFSLYYDETDGVLVIGGDVKIKFKSGEGLIN